MRVLLVSYHFPPSKAVGARRAARLARYLPKLGYDVDVVCGVPSIDAPRAAPPMGVSGTIHRVEVPFPFGRDPQRPPPIDSHPGKRAWWKARAYAEWLFRTRDWAWYWGRAAAAVVGGLIDRYDVLILDGPPHHTIGPVARTARAHGVPIVLDLRDVWALTDDRDDGKLTGWLSPRTRRARWSRSERSRALAAASHVVVTTPEMLEAVRRCSPGLPTETFSCVPNAYGPVDDDEPFVAERPTGAIRLVYTGSLAYGRDRIARDTIHGIAQLRARGGPVFELIVAGAGSEGLEEAAKSAGIPEQVATMGWVEEDAAVELQRTADALLLLQPAESLGTRVAVPAKLFEYMARRRHVLALVGGGAAGRLVESADLGIVGTGSAPDEIAASLEALARRIRARRRLPRPPAQFSEESTMREFGRILSQVAAAND